MKLAVIRMMFRSYACMKKWSYSFKNMPILINLLVTIWPQKLFFFLFLFPPFFLNKQQKAQTHNLYLGKVPVPAYGRGVGII